MSSGFLTPTVLGVQRRANGLPIHIGIPNAQHRATIRGGYLTPPITGGQSRANWLHPCYLGVLRRSTRGRDEMWLPDSSYLGAPKKGKAPAT